MPGEPINEAAVRQMVEGHGFDWHYRHSTESTNADVLHYSQQYQREVVAVQRGAERGPGSAWSPVAVAVCTQYLLHHRHQPRRFRRAARVCSASSPVLRCAGRCEQGTDAMVGLKWPNDLLFEGRKLGGILIESRPLDESLFYFAIGFGLERFHECR